MKVAIFGSCPQLFWLDEFVEIIQAIEYKLEWSTPECYNIDLEIGEPTPYVGNFKLATPAQKVWASALRQFYHR